ncbi:protein HAPLESS 2-like isoform X2 [Silene latifolia]|uniref:protein HAPLESS 2-like isoform X2 n=1 Tax=Silene latifolia TaxID=37657 RepID=UPI003D76CD1D
MQGLTRIGLAGINHLYMDAGPRYFSIGITEVLNANLLIELGADDIEYVNQRSPGKILGITVLTFEALAQFGIAKIEIKNVGEVEPSYSLTFQCSEGVMMSEEQFFIMKPEEVVTRFCKVDPTTDQAAKYACSGKAICSSFFLFCVCLNGNLGHSQNLIFCKLIIVPVTTILKDSEFKEVDRAECQFTTTATVLDNGTLGPPFQPSLFESIKSFWNKFWAGLSVFIMGKSCRISVPVVSPCFNAWGKLFMLGYNWDFLVQEKIRTGYADQVAARV